MKTTFNRLTATPTAIAETAKMNDTVVSIVEKLVYIKLLDKNQITSHLSYDGKLVELARIYGETENMVDDMECAVDSIAEDSADVILEVCNINANGMFQFDIDEIVDAIYAAKETACTRIANRIKDAALPCNMPFAYNAIRGIIGKRA